MIQRLTSFNFLYGKFILFENRLFLRFCLYGLVIVKKRSLGMLYMYIIIFVGGGGSLGTDKPYYQWKCLTDNYMYQCLIRLRALWLDIVIVTYLCQQSACIVWPHELVKLPTWRSELVNRGSKFSPSGGFLLLHCDITVDLKHTTSQNLIWLYIALLTDFLLFINIALLMINGVENKIRMTILA